MELFIHPMTKNIFYTMRHLVFQQCELEYWYWWNLRKRIGNRVFNLHSTKAG